MEKTPAEYMNNYKVNQKEHKYANSNKISHLFIELNRKFITNYNSIQLITNMPKKERNQKVKEKRFQHKLQPYENNNKKREKHYLV